MQFQVLHPYKHMVGFPLSDYNAQGILSHVTVAGSKLSILDGSAFAGLEIQNIQLNKNELYFISEYAFRWAVWQSF